MDLTFRYRSVILSTGIINNTALKYDSNAGEQ